MLVDNLPAVIAFGIGLSAPLMMLAATRQRPDTTRASAALFAEVFTAVVLGVVAARFVVLPWLQRL